MEVLNKRELAEERLDARVKRTKSDPRNIKPRTAAVPKPTKKDLISERKKKSRF